MRGKNPIRKPEIGDGNSLLVVKIFPTLQGEGLYAGHKAVFVRLGGCNLACDFCDTEFEDFSLIKLEDIVNNILSFNSNLVVITGGEPMRQNIAPLCEKLLENGKKVQIETNGTIYYQLPRAVEIICSPKNISGKYYPVRADLLPSITAFKFLISASFLDYYDVPEIGQEVYNTPIYVQPMDEYDEEKNSENLARATELALAHGYILSLQLHKITNIE